MPPIQKTLVTLLRAFYFFFSPGQKERARSPALLAAAMAAQPNDRAIRIDIDKAKT